MLTRKKVQMSILMVVGIVVLVNLLSSRFFLRLDFTADQRYSLSEATKNILDELEDPVTITAYFTEDLPAEVEKVKADFRDLLIEYNNRSDGQVVFEFVDPSEDQESEVKAQQAGVQPLMINVREKDQMKQQKVYLGALLQLGDKREVIPVIQPGAAMEFALSSSIKKISVTNKPKVGILQGYGQPPLDAVAQLKAQLDVLYDVVEVQINDTANIPSDVNTLLEIAPKDSINADYFAALDQFMARGGKLLLALNGVDGDLQNAKGTAVNLGYNNWLASKGIEVKPDFVIDANCASVTVQQRTVLGMMNSQRKFPYLPIISTFGDHPVSTGLEAIILPFASPVVITPADTSTKVYPLALTSEYSGTVPTPVQFDINHRWSKLDYAEPNITVAAAIEGKVGGVNTKMVVIGDGDFVINGTGQNQQRLSPDNVSLVANAVDWLGDESGLVDLRTKGVTSRPINEGMDEGTKAFYKYLNFLLPLLLVIGYGIYRSQLRMKKRNKLMSEDYVQ